MTLTQEHDPDPDQVGDMELRRREVDAAGFQCEGCACGLDVGDGASDLDACRRRFAADAFRAFAGPLLERQGHTLQAVQQAMCPCGGAEVSCGDAMVALPTLIHRGPGNTSDTQTRDVLYFTLQPTGFPNRRRSVPAPLAPDDDSQVSALWLLLLGGSTGQLRPGLYERVEASYTARGIPFSQFMVGEAEGQARDPWRGDPEPQPCLWPA